MVDHDPQFHLLNQLAKQCLLDSENWFPENAKRGIPAIVHHALALGGEAGEVLNVIKKLDRGDYELTDEMFRFKVADEMADVLIYLSNLSALLDIDLLKEYIRKRRVNEQRFGKRNNATHA